jgi:hypothetical protein
MLSGEYVTYKLSSAIQVVKGDLVHGYIVEKISAQGKIVSDYFTAKTKNAIIEDIKKSNGIKSKSQELVDKIMKGDLL